MCYFPKIVLAFYWNPNYVWLMFFNIDSELPPNVVCKIHDYMSFALALLWITYWVKITDLSSPAMSDDPIFLTVPDLLVSDPDESTGSSIVLSAL